MSQSLLHLLQRNLLAGLALAVLAACGGEDSSTEVDGAGQPPAAGAAADTGPRIGKRRNGTKSRVHIVQLREPAVAAYGGGLPGYAATRPGAGRKLDARSPAVAGYRSHLKARQAAVLAGVGGPRSLYSYAYTFNGFAAELSDAQVRQLAATPGVVAVTADEWRPLHTASTPGFLGLDGEQGLWEQTGARGENIVIGILDTGIRPELASFSDLHRRSDLLQPQGGRELPYLPLAGWNGQCQAGEQFGPEHCNHKLIGARYFNAGLGGDAGVKVLAPGEFNSPRDRDGHGTHTASTAAGNARVAATGPAAIFGGVSGMAPRARIAVYKVCWQNVGCPVSDSIAAIEQAIEDGVDVINFSVGGASADLLDPVEQAFMRAADAGIFVAASAGNDGTPGSVEHPGPWVTTVAAGTHNRTVTATLTLGSGAAVRGASTAAAALAPAPLINAADAGLPGADAQALRQCFAASDPAGVAVLDPNKVRGRIVVCDRGGNNRTSKSLAVQQAGGVGMVLVNIGEDDLVADFHALPTVHLSAADGTAVKAFAAQPGATASLGAAVPDFGAPAPRMAGFSSRGPTPAAGGSLLKPDLVAPGVDILAGVAPADNGGPEFDVLSGTSMSSPHIAGIAALLKEVHPDWSPMAIKSALMTSAGDVLDGPATDAAVLFGQGAGHVRPRAALEPGLVFDAGLPDWLGFLCATQLPAAQCAEAGVAAQDPADLNTASIALGSLAGVQVVTRRVTHVGRGLAVYTAAVTGMAGFDVTVAPRVLVLRPGQTRSFRVAVRRVSAAFDAHAGGQLTWTGMDMTQIGRQQRVRVPLVVRPVALAAPAEAGAGYAVKFGYSGAFRAVARGLAAADRQAAQVAQGSQVALQVSVPPGTTHARFALFDADATAASDLDLVVLDAAGNQLGGSFGFTSAEQVDLPDPAPGVYTVIVSGYFVPESGTAGFTLSSWTVGSDAAGNMTVTAPAAAVAGKTGNVGLAFGALEPGIRYLGAVAYDGDAGPLPGRTLVRVGP